MILGKRDLFDTRDIGLPLLVFYTVYNINGIKYYLFLNVLCKKSNGK